ncbi:hypothetical protein ES702_06513 [subsurface metagenome]
MSEIKKFVIIILVICVAIGGFFWYISEKERKEIAEFKEGEEISKEEEYIEKKEEYPLLPLEEELLPYPKYPWIGEYPFRVSSGKGIYPKFKSGKFSKRPMDFVVGEDKKLEASIKVEDPDGVSKVKLVVIGYKEDLEEEIEFKLSDGDSKSGTWSGTLAIPEEMKRIFWTNFYTESKSGKTEDLHLDWRPGATCAFKKGNITTFGSGGCNVASDEVVGSETGEITVAGDVNLTGTEGHPAYMIFGTKVTFSGGRIVFSAHQGGKATAILIKAGRTDSFFGWAAHIYVRDVDDDGFWDNTIISGKHPGCTYQSAGEDLYDSCPDGCDGNGACQ